MWVRFAGLFALFPYTYAIGAGFGKVKGNFKIFWDFFGKVLKGRGYRCRAGIWEPGLDHPTLRGVGDAAPYNHGT